MKFTKLLFPTLFLFISHTAFTQPSRTVVLLPSKDNTMYNTFGGDTLSNGAGDHIFAGRAGNGNVHRSLMKFEFPDSIPPTAIVEFAQLEMNRSNNQTPENGRIIRLYRLNSDWGEGSSHAPMGEGQGTQAQPGDASWYHTFYPDEFWGSEGGDFEASPSANWVTGNTTPLWGPSDQMNEDLQLWLADDNSNFGWLIKMDDEPTASSSNRFDSKDHFSASVRPQLTLTYRTLAIFSIQIDGSQAGTGSPALGNGIATYNAETGECTVTGQYSGLGSNTTAAHVHDGDSGVNGPIVFPLTLSPASGTAGTFTGTATLNPLEGMDLILNGLYVNIHTNGEPGGEIRGQIKIEKCPEEYMADGFPIPSFAYRAIELSSAGSLESGEASMRYENTATLEPGFETESGAVLEILQEVCE